MNYVHFSSGESDQLGIFRAGMRKNLLPSSEQPVSPDSELTVSLVERSL